MLRVQQMCPQAVINVGLTYYTGMVDTVSHIPDRCYIADGFEPSEELVSELQDHVKQETAPYKYPRIVDFAAELPKTTSGKVQRAVLRGS